MIPYDIVWYDTVVVLTSLAPNGKPKGTASLAREENCYMIPYDAVWYDVVVVRTSLTPDGKPKSTAGLTR